ncbi:LON peptidase N-terminal domain and RING finger protein 1 [Purpureocillium lavendulum]|uniref:LON peptidase N-terminal domain and RING finger protein 1 n=1 Tax=Purpureocillium lavendulum TaxID=1247861 RepID=A0AB34G2K3_9HYPO|nr:LON peptidase N-terminal domain and RING finger protein 1 [Purpureocillium lavendulum]
MYSSSFTPAALALLATSAAAKVIVVNVGQGGFTFSPDSIKAAAGDNVEFHFFGQHTAVSADFSKPCSPASTGFFSGDMQNKGIFTVTVNNTDPIFFYCAIDGHCQGGMVGVINEGSDKLTAFKAAAGKTDSSSAPAAAYGGVNGPAPSGGASASGSAASGTPTGSATSSGTAASASPTKTSGSQPGAAGLTGPVAGVGGLALAVAALFALDPSFKDRPAQRPFTRVLHAVSNRMTPRLVHPVRNRTTSGLVIDALAQGLTALAFHQRPRQSPPTATPHPSSHPEGPSLPGYAAAEQSQQGMQGLRDDAAGQPLNEPPSGQGESQATSQSQGDEAHENALDPDAIWNPTPSPDQVRDIVRLFQCLECGLPYEDAVTLPCGNSICRMCLPETRARTAITYPSNPSRVRAFHCPFIKCGKEHVLDDCGVDVVLNKAAKIMASEIGHRATEAAKLGIATNLFITQEPGQVQTPGLSASTKNPHIVDGDKLLATWAMAVKGNLKYEADVSYSELPAQLPPVDDEGVATFETMTLSKVQQAMRSEMDCQICYALLYDPLTTGCGHTFCRPCLHRILDHSHYCPICRRRLLMNPLLNRTTCPSNTTIIEITKIFWINELTHREQAIAAERAARVQHMDLPLFVCGLVFPTMSTFLHVFEPQYRLMIRRALDGDKTFGMVLPRRPRYAGDANFYELGTLVRIVNAQYYADGRSLIEIVGLSRFRIVRHGRLDGYAIAGTERIDDVSMAEEESLEASEVGPDPGGESPERSPRRPRRRTPPGGDGSSDNDGNIGNDGDRGNHGNVGNGRDDNDVDNGGNNDEDNSEQGGAERYGAHRSSDNQPQPHDEGPSSASPLLPRGTEWIPRTEAEMDFMTTQGLFRFATGFVQRAQEQNVFWLTQRTRNVYGDCPDDPATFPWWFASLLPIKDAEKYRLLGTSSVRDRLKICGTWILEMERVSW